MPLHDWTRAPDYVYHEFHGRWLFAVCDALNGGVLPPGYYARAEQVTRPAGPDVLALQALPPDRFPDVPVGNPAAVRLTVADAPPRVAVAAAAAPRPTAFPQRRVKVRLRHRSGDPVVAIVELVSRGNKSSAKRLAAFVRKVVQAVDAAVNVLVVDPFPPTRRDPASLHGAIWPELGGDPYTPPPGKPLTLAAYEAGDDGPRCYVEPLAAGDRLTDMPLFLEPGEYVYVPLEATYQAAWADVLPQDRVRLEG